MAMDPVKGELWPSLVGLLPSSGLGRDEGGAGRLHPLASPMGKPPVLPISPPTPWGVSPHIWGSLFSASVLTFLRV